MLNESDVCAGPNSTLRIILNLGFGDLQFSACDVETVIDCLCCPDQSAGSVALVVLASDDF